MDMPLLNTSNLEMASTLYTLGLPIKGIHSVGNSTKLEFFFEDTDKVRQTMQDYYDRKLRVEPNELFWARREILTRMKNVQNT
jgi:hypothetical protein